MGGLQRFAELFNTVEALFDRVQASRVGKPNGAVIAKGDPGNDCDVVLGEQALREVAGVQAKLGDVGQNVESAFGLDDADTGDRAEALDHVLTAEVEFLTHFLNRRLIPLEGGEAAFLGEGARVGG